MIFYIVIAAVLIAVVWIVIYATIYDGLGIGLLYGILTAICGAVIGFLLMLFASIWMLGPYHNVGKEDHSLTALQTSSSVEGRTFFLGSGYINGKRTLNYITNDGGAYRVQSADAVDSVIYQDSETPIVTVYEWDLENPWFAPFVLGHKHTYDFHIPEGSILSDYTIDNG